MNNLKYYNNLWDGKTSGELNPIWSYEDDLTELSSFLGDKKYDCLELGCGNGDSYESAQDYYSRYMGLDFSTSNIEIFKTRFPKIELLLHDVVNFIPPRKISLIHSNQLLQYLTKNQIKDLIKWNIQYCSDDGIILHRQIPDKKLMNLYFSGYLKPNLNSRKMTRIMFPLLYRLYSFYKKIILSHSDFGYWYSADEILQICSELGVDGKIYGSALYRYRFNLLIRL